MAESSENEFSVTLQAQPPLAVKAEVAPITYHFVTDDDKTEELAKALHGREIECANYELNQQNYAAALEALKDLPEEWPSHLVMYKDYGGEALAKALQGTEYETVAALQFRDQLRVLARTNKIEHNKAKLIHAAMARRLPTDTQARAELIVKTQAFFNDKKKG